jgi:hypothetical protein
MKQKIIGYILLATAIVAIGTAYLITQYSNLTLTYKIIATVLAGYAIVGGIVGSGLIVTSLNLKR